MDMDGATKDDQHDLNQNRSDENVQLRTDFTQRSDSEAQETEKVGRETSQIKTCSTQLCTSSTQPSDSEERNKEVIGGKSLQPTAINTDVYVHTDEISIGTSDFTTNNEDSSVTGDGTSSTVRDAVLSKCCSNCKFMKSELARVAAKLERLKASYAESKSAIKELRENIKKTKSNEASYIGQQFAMLANIKSELRSDIHSLLYEFLQDQRSEFNERFENIVHRLKTSEQETDSKSTKHVENPENIAIGMAGNQNDDDQEDIKRALDDVNGKLFWLFKMFCNLSEPIKVSSAHRSNDSNKLVKEIINFQVTRFYDNGSNDNKMVESEYSGTVPDYKDMGNGGGKGERAKWPIYEDKKMNSKTSCA